MTRALLSAIIVATLCRAQVTYKVQLPGPERGAVVELPAEKYVAAVVAGESSTFRSEEALKAMAVAARTYAARLRGRHRSEGFDFCATTHCQRLDLAGGTRPDLVRAAESTAGELLWFEGKLAFAAYTRDCGGETETVSQVWPDIQAAYLKTHSDPFCTRHGAETWSWAAQSADIAAALRKSQLAVPDGLKRLLITQTSESHRARTLELVGPTSRIALSASSFRFAIDRELGWNTLRSDRYQVNLSGAQIYFRGTGQGHGVGLCQRGAEEMGLEGKTYTEILAFYYPGTVVALTGAGLKWVQMAGENVTVFSTQPDRDRSVLNAAELLNRAIAAQVGARAARVTVRVYSDVETFRNVTGEPGWVAARTSGSTIELQPLSILEARGILRQTLRHELLHVAIERLAAPRIPVWFREGLVEYLDGAPAAAPPDKPIADADIRQRQDSIRAHQAYREASIRVHQLVNRYGEPAVLGWLVRGLPAEVTNSSASSAATNNK